MAALRRARARLRAPVLVWVLVLAVVASLALLDRFEGSLYERRRLSVLGAAGRVLDAEVYVTAETCRHLLSDEPWDLDRFVSTHLDDWVHHCASLRRPSAADFPA